MANPVWAPVSNLPLQSPKMHTVRGVHAASGNLGLVWVAFLGTPWGTVASALGAALDVASPVSSGASTIGDMGRNLMDIQDWEEKGGGCSRPRGDCESHLKYGASTGKTPSAFVGT